MAASNNNWVCFSCHFKTRQAKTSLQIPKCPECGRDCFCLGYKVEVPKKDDLGGWKRLQASCRQRQVAQRAELVISRSQRRHWLEKEIIRLESMEENRDRRKKIRLLQAELNEIC